MFEQRAKRVLFFGFSVTEQPGYVPALKGMLGEREIEIESRAIGGINLCSLPYMHSVLEYECYDHVVFEVTTCRRYAEDNPGVYGDPLKEIIDQVRARGAEPSFIHLFRKGVDYSHDHMLDSAAAICAERDVRYLNLVPQMVEFERAGLLYRFLRDGIHSTEEGAAHYAQAVLPFLDLLLDDGRDVRQPGEPDPAPSRALVPIDKLVGGHDFSSFKRGNLVMPVCTIPGGESLSIDIPAGYALEGLIYLRTPQAGLMEVDLGEQGTRRVHAFDQHSYYRRYSTWTVPACTTPSITITQRPEMPEVELVKGECDPGERLGEVCGLFLSAGS